MSKSETAVFLDNFYSALRMLGRNPGGGALELRSGAGVFSTGLPFAGENYALFDPSSSAEELCGVLDFYEERNLPFIALQLPKLQGKLALELERRRIFHRATYLAMSIGNLPAKMDGDPLVKKIYVNNEAEKWAEAAWTGFEGELPVPRAYVEFSQYLLRCPDNSLFVLEKEGIPLCSALLHSTEKSCGLYYFATRPETRREGLAARLMDSLREYASGHSEAMVLLATEMGAKMYKKYGFRELLEVPVFSASDEF